MSSKWRHRGQDWQDMRDGAMARLSALDEESEPDYWKQLDAVLDAMEFYGFEIVPTALVDAVASEYLNPEGFNVQRLAKAVGNLVLAYRGDLVRAPVLSGQTEETQP